MANLVAVRFRYFIAALIVVIAGLASRECRAQLPPFLSEYAGDTLWALMLFLLISMLLAGRPMLTRTFVSLAVAFLVEVSQLYHAPWIDSIRQTTLGGLVLGFGFLWSDLVCYSVGVMIGVITALLIDSNAQCKFGEHTLITKSRSFKNTEDRADGNRGRAPRVDAKP